MTDDKAEERSDLWASELDEEHTSDAMDAVDAQSAWDVESIRDSWHPNSIRLPDGLQRRFDSYHKRLDWEFTNENVDRDFGKDRQYKPLVIALGLHALDAMDTSDVVDALDTLERVEHLDDFDTSE